MPIFIIKGHNLCVNMYDTINSKSKNCTAYTSYNLPETKTEMLKDAPLAGIMYDFNTGMWKI